MSQRLLTLEEKAQSKERRRLYKLRYYKTHKWQKERYYIRRFKGKAQCVDCKKKIRLGSTRCISCSKLCDRNPMWVDDKATYMTVHNWVRRRKPKPLMCERCHKRKAYDLANISQKYIRDINDFEWLCRRCHMKEDGRLKVFIDNNKTGEPKSEKQNAKVVVR